MNEIDEIKLPLESKLEMLEESEELEVKEIEERIFLANLSSDQITQTQFNY
jgi:hypothetical protein